MFRFYGEIHKQAKTSQTRCFAFQTHRHLKGNSVPLEPPWNEIQSMCHHLIMVLTTWCTPPPAPPSLRYHCSEQLLLSGGSEPCGSITFLMS